jgi:hypothetical protein
VYLAGLPVFTHEGGPHMASQKKARSKPDLDTLIQKFVQDIEPSLSDVIAEMPNAWRELLKASADDFSARGFAELLSTGQLENLEIRITQSLVTEEAREAFVQFSEAHSSELMVTQDLAFAIGVAFGRGGGR